MEVSASGVSVNRGNGCATANTDAGWETGQRIDKTPEISLA